MCNQRPSASSLIAIFAALSLAGFSGSCFSSGKPPQPFTPPPPQPAPVAASAEHLPEPPLTASLPDLSEGAIVPNGVPEAAPPPAPKPPPRRPPTRATPPQTAAVTTPEPTATPPKLGQIYSPEQTREYNRTVDECLDRVRKVVSAMSRKTLNTEQTEILNRVLTFQRQAEESRSQDLGIAMTLAKRADVLAKDLQDRVQ